MNYIIIQAGGKGTRLKELTRNKPKAIVSVNTLPMIYHLFRMYPNSKFIIIGDYLRNVLDNYLQAFPEVQFITVGVNGHSGTCSGIRNALRIIPPKERFMLIWSDLVLDKEFKVPCSNFNIIGISGTFPCRWSYSGGKFIEERSCEDGVAGMFVFTDKSWLADVPESGEFVKWLQSKEMVFDRHILGDTAEYGLIDSIKNMGENRCRPFNSMKIVDGKLIKEGIDEQGKTLAVREKRWYNHVKNLDVPIPKIYSFNPLTLELIDGKNVFEYTLSDSEKEIILEKLMNGLQSIHKYNHAYPDRFSMKKAYYDKTLDRLEKVRNLIPMANDEYITINGKKCRNVFFHLDELREKLYEIPCGNFCLIHGDCTFSNIMLRNGQDPVFIDPRGYFGNCELIGDPNYDWAKLYYSVYGDYDQFNLGRFSLVLNNGEVRLDISSNGWRSAESKFIELLPKGTNIETIRLIHAVIWLSLTTYAWNDYDSICGAFYNGLYYLEDVL